MCDPSTSPRSYSLRSIAVEHVHNRSSTRTNTESQHGTTLQIEKMREQKHKTRQTRFKTRPPPLFFFSHLPHPGQKAKQKPSMAVLVFECSNSSPKAPQRPRRRRRAARRTSPVGPIPQTPRRSRPALGPRIRLRPRCHWTKRIGPTA